MSTRATLPAAALLGASLLLACGQERPGSNPGGQDAGGCIGAACFPEADGGTGADGGPTDGSVPTTLEDLRRLDYGTKVVLEDVVVHTVDDGFTGTMGRCAGNVGADFWVTGAQLPERGLFVRKDCEDPPTTYQPTVGDVLTLEGYFQSLPPYADREGRRQVLANQFNLPGCSGGSCPGKLVITQKGTQAVAPFEVGDGYGNAEGGERRPNPEQAGALVHIPGPLTLTQPNPAAFKRVSAVASDEVHFGFEVSGGVLVNNYKTFGRTRDGGTERCDWRERALDGGTVVFPEGITGVWDTYTHAPCEDGGISNCDRRKFGSVPGTDGGNYFTYVLYPQTCADLQGDVVQ